MILNAEGIENDASLITDVCIVGSGAAGITLALELSRAGVATVILAGGAERERPTDRDLYRGVIDPGYPHEPLEENRRRAFGGSTIAWGGRCVPMEEIDFEHRAWIPNSGWPITYSGMLPYFKRAMELCEAGPFAFDAADTFSSATASMVDGFDGPDVISSRIERWSPPTNFAKRYAPELRRAPRLQVLVGGHAIHIWLKPSGTSVDRVSATAGHGHEFSVRARVYVLAAGGLENPRLLLSSRDTHVNGIGNTNGLVGRFYMSHLLGAAQAISIANPERGFRYDFEKDQCGVYCRRRFSLTPLAQAKREVGNAIATLDRPPIGNAAHRDPIFSAAFLVKDYGDVMRRAGLRNLASELHGGSRARREHWNVIAHASPASMAAAVRAARRRYLARRRLPMLLGQASAPMHHLYYQTEHAPNRDSRVELSGERDPFGLPRITVRVAFSEVDVDTVVELHRAIAARFDKSATGSLEFDENHIREYVTESFRKFNSQAHHLGTTRMSDSEATGVVDSDSRVHGMNDLFVTGSSVFPTGGHANPTLTIVALAARLGTHISRTVAG